MNPSACRHCYSDGCMLAEGTEPSRPSYMSMLYIGDTNELVEEVKRIETAGSLPGAVHR